jgi:hypothetical protein
MTAKPMDLRKHTIRSLSDFDRLCPKFKFAVMYEETISYMGADYGPPDPPPSMVSETVIRILAFETKEQVIEWVNYHTRPQYRRPAPYKVFKIEGCQVSTEIKIDI